MFHFRRSCVSAPILFRAERYEMNRIRLPHSEIHGSQPVCGYPRLIAAYHVLHRLPVPRHPLHTLYILHCLIHFDDSRGNRNGTQARIFETIWSQLLALCKIVFYPIYSCQRTSKIRNYLSLANGGQDWTRTSDPRLIKAVL